MPEELWTEVHNNVQESVTKTIPKKKKCKKAKWLSENALKTEKKKSERQRRKGKIHPTGCRVQRTARRDKKAFLSEQCKEIGESNRMEKTRGLLKKIREIKELVHARMGMEKDRKSKNLTEAEDIKRR